MLGDNRHVYSLIVLIFTLVGIKTYGREDFQKTNDSVSIPEIKLQVDGDAKFIHYRMNNRDFSSDLRDRADWTQGIFDLGLAFEPHHDFRLITDLQYSKIFGSNGTSGDTKFDGDTFRVHEAYLNWTPKYWDISAGRQSWNYSEGFVISSFDDEIGVSQDGVRVSREFDYNWLNQMDFLFAINADRNASVLSSHLPGLTSSEERDDKLYGIYLLNRRDGLFLAETDFYILHSEYGHSKDTADKNFLCSIDPNTSQRNCVGTKRSVVPKYFETIGLRLLAFTFEKFTFLAEGGVQTGKTRVLRESRSNASVRGNVRSKALRLQSSSQLGDVTISLGWDYASGSDPGDDWNSDIKGWQPLYHKGNYSFGSNGILAFTNYNDYFLKFRYDFFENLKSEFGIHKLSFINYRLGPIYAAEYRSESPDNEIEYSRRDTGSNTYHSTDIGEVYDLGFIYYLSRKINFKTSLLIHNPGDFYKHSTLASSIYGEAIFKF